MKRVLVSSLAALWVAAGALSARGSDTPDGVPRAAHLAMADDLGVRTVSERRGVGSALDTPVLGTAQDARVFSPSPGVHRTVPCHHDRSARSLEDVVAHYALLFDLTRGGLIHLTAHDQADIVALLKLLD